MFQAVSEMGLFGAIAHELSLPFCSCMTRPDHEFPETVWINNQGAPLRLPPLSGKGLDPEDFAEMMSATSRHFSDDCSDFCSEDCSEDRSDVGDLSGAELAEPFERTRTRGSSTEFYDVSTPRRKTTGSTDERPDDCFSLREELANKGAQMSSLERELQETKCREAVAERERLVYLKMIADLVASQDVTGGLPQLPLREPDPEQVPETSSEASSRRTSAAALLEAPSAEARQVRHGVSFAPCEQRPQ